MSCLSQANTLVTWQTTTLRIMLQKHPKSRLQQITCFVSLSSRLSSDEQFSTWAGWWIDAMKFICSVGIFWLRKSVKMNLEPTGLLAYMFLEWHQDGRYSHSHHEGILLWHMIWGVWLLPMGILKFLSCFIFDSTWSISEGRLCSLHTWQLFYSMVRNGVRL